ncbi:MAG: hypothetical protein ACOX7Q_12125 [Kiritimatiellia bacterium]|jgi:hypothetical protein|nr:hypothetical protein [Planctomycetota bacterium]
MKLTLVLLALALKGTMIASADDSNEIASIRGLVSGAEMQARSIGARDAEGLGDVFHVIHRKAECVALQDKMVEAWPFVLHHLDEVAPTESGKAMVMISTGRMAVSSYLDFLDTVAELVESGTLDRKFFMWAQFPPEGGLCNVLIKHHADSKAQTVIMRAKKIFQDVPEKIATYDAMLTGESKKKLEDYEARLAPPSSGRTIRHQNNEKSPANNHAASMCTQTERTSLESYGSNVSNEIAPPLPPVPTPIRGSGFVWLLLVVALVFIVTFAVWFLRSL